MTHSTIRFFLSAIVAFNFTASCAFGETADQPDDMAASLKRIEEQIMRLSQQGKVPPQASPKSLSSESRELSKKNSPLDYRVKLLEKHIQALEAEVHRLSSIVERTQHFIKQKHTTKPSTPLQDQNTAKRNTPPLDSKQKLEQPPSPLPSHQKGTNVTSTEAKTTNTSQKAEAPLGKKEKITNKAEEGATTTNNTSDEVLFSPKDDVEGYNLIQRTIRENKLSIAAEQIENFLQKFPNSSLKPNLLYWAGEISRNQNKHEKAASYFLSVYTQHPKHAKAPESLLKLAYSLNDLGKITEAKSTLTRLANEYPHIDNNLLILMKNLQDQLGN